MNETNTMRCPFCAANVPNSASVCRYCGNDLKIPDSLTAENAELKEHVATLQHELKALHGKLVRRKDR